MVTKGSTKEGLGFVFEYFEEVIRNPFTTSFPDTPQAQRSRVRNDASGRCLKAADGLLIVQDLASGILAECGFRGELIACQEVASADLTTGAGGGCRLAEITPGTGSGFCMTSHLARIIHRIYYKGTEVQSQGTMDV